MVLAENRKQICMNTANTTQLIIPKSEERPGKQIQYNKTKPDSTLFTDENPLVRTFARKQKQRDKKSKLEKLTVSKSQIY